MRKALMASAVLLHASSTAVAADKICAPAALLKVVTTMDAPNLLPDHFARAPKTLYRIGEGKGRVEESPDPQTGRRLLIVVYEPHIWVADLAQSQGTYQRDPGPTYYFKARLFDNATAKSDFIRRLEFGCEVPWMDDAGIRPSPITHPTLGRVNKMEFVEADERLILLERRGKPLRAELYGPSGWVMSIEYVTYDDNAKPTPHLFTKPKGVAFDIQPKR